MSTTVLGARRAQALLTLEFSRANTRNTPRARRLRRRFAP